MPLRHNLARYVVIVSMSIMAGAPAFADCNTGVADATCPPGSINNILNNNNIQMQDALNREAAAQAQRDADAQAQRDAQAQAQRDADAQKYNEEVAAAAADPRNRNNPDSPYYWAKQCENAKHTLFCAFGISCEPPADLDCARAGRNSLASHHHLH